MNPEKLVFPNCPGGPFAGPLGALEGILEVTSKGVSYPNSDGNRPSSAGLSAYTQFLSDESKVLLLAHLYLELCLNAEQAFRAARADVMTATPY
jgi:hypothetical protein